MKMNDRIKDSKRIAYILRHSKLPDGRGWVTINVLQSELNLSLEDILEIVNDDTKGRFEISKDETAIKALYGHSVKVDLGLEPATPPAVLYHGTAEKYLGNIKREGLKPQKRNYVHLSETTDMASEVGTRHGNPVLLSIDTMAMIASGHKFYKVKNGIWLTGDIPAQFLKVICYE